MIPPQTHPGEYAAIVLEHLGGALSVRNYFKIFDFEYFEITVLEKKGLLQDRLHSLLLHDPRLEQVVNLMPNKEIRAEAYDFLEEKVAPVNSMRHAFQRHLMEGSFNFFLQELDQKGRNSQLYREFDSYYIDEEFRRKMGLPLPGE